MLAIAMRRIFSYTGTYHDGVHKSMPAFLLLEQREAERDGG